MSLGDSNHDSLLTSLNQQAARLTAYPFMVLLMVYLFFHVGLPDIIQHYSLGAMGLVGFTLWLRHVEKARKLTVLFYEPDDAVAKQFESLSGALRHLAQVRKLKTIISTSTYRDTKYTGGAVQAHRFGPCDVNYKGLRNILTNVEIPVLACDKISFAFYPDRVLLKQNRNIGAIRYENLMVTTGPFKFNEKSVVPADATVIGNTWQYVNQDGGPDKRFKLNRKIPVCRYQYLRLSSKDGLEVQLMSSKEDAFTQFAVTLKAMAETTAHNASAEPCLPVAK